MRERLSSLLISPTVLTLTHIRPAHALCNGQWDDAGGKMYRVTKSGTYIIKDGNLAELGMSTYGQYLGCQGVDTSQYIKTLCTYMMAHLM